MTKPVTPGLEFVFTIRAEIDPPRSAGKGPGGERLHIPITGGRVSGPRLNGKILPDGSDWPLIGSDGNSLISAHYTVETDDGTLIYVRNKGLRISPPSVMARLRAREPVEPTEYYFRTVPVFDAPDGPYQWLRETIFVGSAMPTGATVEIDIFRVS